LGTKLINPQVFDRTIRARACELGLAVRLHLCFQNQAFARNMAVKWSLDLGKGKESFKSIAIFCDSFCKHYGDNCVVLEQ
jgi:hypothetical protein